MFVIYQVDTAEWISITYARKWLVLRVVHPRGLVWRCSRSFRSRAQAVFRAGGVALSVPGGASGPRLTFLVAPWAGRVGRGVALGRHLWPEGRELRYW